VRHTVCKSRTFNPILKRINSASTGSSFGQFVLGMCHHQNKGFPQDKPRDKASDYAEALAHWTLAANQGLSSAQFGLGVMYSNGLGVAAPDQEKAFTLIKMAAVQGYKTAQFMAGIFCQNGLGTAADTNEARRWCQLSAAQGVKDAIKFLKSLPEQHEDHANAATSRPA
jgi:TPR repeat protein